LSRPQRFQCGVMCLEELVKYLLSLKQMVSSPGSWAKLNHFGIELRVVRGIRQPQHLMMPDSHLK